MELDSNLAVGAVMRELLSCGISLFDGTIQGFRAPYVYRLKVQDYFATQF